MRSLASFMVLLLLACGTNTPPLPPHDATSCDGGWTQNGFDQCEAACADSTVALGASGPSCEATTIAANTIDCSKTFTYDGVMGCCAANQPMVLFAECQ